ncbi:MAG TPA: zf-HC2 domain-containing protein [Candidatus Krumholzibacteria bacterium]|nr:zf-HC2 domain-containing protein [Candidatus Krumholzibacteria bacterium]HPD72930.1 zf-HC2 domain-containing protein [Candidatus Krumholzibacteria bacterium]HRY41729.1 zf-HC2 domain-containing protein [Candidatus Krumholzibacteria bacterium]
MKKNCATIELLLAEYASGDLADADRALVTRHLAGCAACRDELAREQRLREQLGALPPAVCPPAVTAAIRSAVRAETAARAAGRPRRRTRWIGAGAALGLAAAAVLLVAVLPERAPRSPGAVDVASIDSVTITDHDRDRARARRDVEWALSYTAGIVDRTEKESIAGVLRHLVTAGPSGS